MAHKRSPGRFLLDTSAVIHHLHGHTLQQFAVGEAVAGGRSSCAGLRPHGVYARGDPQPDRDSGASSATRQGYDDDLLLDFYQRFTAVQESVPDCRLCDFRKSQGRRLRRRETTLTAPSPCEVRVQPRLRPPVPAGRTAAKTRARAVMRLVRAAGDTIIALQDREASPS